MANELSPTATNGALMSMQKSLGLSQLGFELLDRKRNILIREMMQLIDRAKELRGEISSTYHRAYEALQRANITLGLVQNFAQSVPIDNGIRIQYRSVMGIEIPIVQYQEQRLRIHYGLDDTNSYYDNAVVCFDRAKKITAVLAEVENSIYRLANAIQKTQRRANALDHIVIPRYQHTVKYISDALEEKEREEFGRLKVIKAAKNRHA